MGYRADSDLTSWFGDLLEGLEVLPDAFSTIAVGADMAPGMGVDPSSIMALVAISSSCAFMLPVGTPPNAAVFRSDYLTMNDMITAGFWTNIAALTLASTFILFWQPVVLSGI